MIFMNLIKIEMYKNNQIICKIKQNWHDFENILDISTFKNGSYCFLYSDKIEYYSRLYEFINDISLDYDPTHFLTLTIKSELYVIIRNNKSLYLYLLDDYEFLYLEKIDLKNDITYWTKTKDNKIIICSKNEILFYEINETNFVKTQNEIKIEEETFIENSSYFKNNKKIKDKLKKEESNSKNIFILKVFELEKDYIIVIKKELYELKDNYIETSDCPDCCTYIWDQTNFILISIIKFNKKTQKMENTYEIEFKSSKFRNEYYHDEYYDLIVRKKGKKNPLTYFDNSIIDSIELLENKIMFYNPELNNVEIIDINSSFRQNYKSILYNSSETIERYKIIFISENCFYKFEYIYYNDSENIVKIITFFDDKEKDKYYDEYYDIVLIKKMNSLLFVFENDTLTISKKLI